MSKINIMRNNLRIVYSVIVLVVAIGWIFASRIPAGNSVEAVPPSAPREGFIAPDFTLDLVGGGEVTLSELRGKVVLVNFWASWCPPCREEMPAIEKIYSAFEPLGLVVLAVNVTNQDSEEAAVKFIKEFDLTFPVPLDRKGDVSARYILRGLPSSYFIDRKGTIRSVVVGGPMSETLIQSKIENLLKESD
jgi:thiol-disulfide isomerase/thioredoxin